MEQKNQIFKDGSKTFYYASRFFPAGKRQDVATLYAFVRLPDNYVDRIPQLPDEFYSFRKLYEQSASAVTGNKVIDDFRALQLRKHFKQAWIEAYLDAMERDLSENVIRTETDMLDYVHGSAEVVGLMMSRILDLPENLDEYAIKLGRAYQLINFIRDVDEDITFGRTYFPEEDLKKFGIYPLTKESIYRHQQEFSDMMRFQIQRFRTWHTEAMSGVSAMPYRYRVPVLTASAQYLWTASVIDRDPMTVMEQK